MGADSPVLVMDIAGGVRMITVIRSGAVASASSVAKRATWLRIAGPKTQLEMTRSPKMLKPRLKSNKGPQDKVINFGSLNFGKRP